MSNAAIRSALESRLSTWADSQTPTPIPVSFQNVAFNKLAGTVFLECFLIPNLTANNELSGSRKTLKGLFQVNCWAPKGYGMRQVELLSQSIVDLYPIVPKTGAVSVEETPSIGRAIPDDSGWVIVPVLIKYRYESV
jgi:hypothetical protein